MDYDRRLQIRNELLEMGATVSDAGTRPQTVIDIGSQFETYSSLADRSQRLPLQQAKNKPSKTPLFHSDSTITGDQTERYYDGDSTDSSTQINAFSEDELDDDDHDGMNYHLILHQNRSNEPEFAEPLVQQSK